MIGRFWGRYRFLSNFWPASVQLDGADYATVEHAYQAAKTVVPSEREVIQFRNTPAGAKAAGKNVTLRTNWKTIRLPVMVDLVTQKFNDPQLGAWLLETGEQELIEGNAWNDKFWGVCRGEGANHLGIILMNVRTKLRLRSH